MASDGTSAAELYRDALKIDSRNDVARSGFDRSIEYGLRTAEEALLASRIDAAAGIAENLRLLVPGNSRLAFLQAQIDKETARISADAQPTAGAGSKAGADQGQPGPDDRRHGTWRTAGTRPQQCHLPFPCRRRSQRRRSGGAQRARYAGGRAVDRGGQ